MPSETSIYLTCPPCKLPIAPPTLQPFCRVGGVREVFDESAAFVCIALATNMVRAAGDGRKNRSSEIIALCLWRGSIYQSSAVILSDTRFLRHKTSPMKASGRTKEQCID